MISIIICSKGEPGRVLENIEKTIGIPHEKIVIDNSRNKYSIFEAYNQGILKSNFELLCFLHEDVYIHTPDWGGIILQIFRDKKQVGIIGLAGSTVKSDIPTGWWEHEKHHLVKNLIQHRPDGKKEQLEFGFGENDNREVAIIDGVFICMKKDKEIKFNENLKGFHNYDQSICLDYLKNGYKILVTKRILLEHFSNGTIDSRWLNATYNFHKVYKKHLPRIIGDAELGNNERVNQISRFIFHCKNTGNAKLAFKFWLKLLKNKPLHPEHKNHIRYFLNFLRTKLV